MATDDSLSLHERVGFPDAYRAGKENVILADVASKLAAIGERSKTIVDIGPGCGALPRLLIEECGCRDHTLVLVDSQEMLSQLPARPFVHKLAGAFPAEEPADGWTGKADAVLVYSVFQYVFAEGNSWAFVDRLLQLLAPAGALLIGDIPNVSKRKRFFASDTGRRFHRDFMQVDEDPEVVFNVLDHGAIDDAVVLALVARARAAGFQAYVVPQHDDLPMANRREDVLVVRP
jgi:hypothetical protein